MMTSHVRDDQLGNAVIYSTSYL